MLESSFSKAFYFTGILCGKRWETSSSEWAKTVHVEAKSSILLDSLLSHNLKEKIRYHKRDVDIGFNIQSNSI